MIGVGITRPIQELIILRGVPGAGKSTEVERLIGDGIVHSTDGIIEATGDYFGFFTTMKETNNWGSLYRVHCENLENAIASMVEGISPVIIDNTNIKIKDFRAYVIEALKLGYDEDNITIVDIGTGGCTAEELAERNTHGVPLSTIEKMIRSHQGIGVVTVEKIVKAQGGKL